MTIIDYTAPATQTLPPPASPITDLATALARSDVHSYIYTSPFNYIDSYVDYMVSQGIIDESLRSDLYNIGKYQVPAEIMDILLTLNKGLTIGQVLGNSTLLNILNGQNTQLKDDIINAMRRLGYIAEGVDDFLSMYINQSVTDRNFMVSLFALPANATISAIKNLQYGVYALNTNQGANQAIVNAALAGLLQKIDARGFLNVNAANFAQNLFGSEPNGAQPLWASNARPATDTLSDAVFTTNYTINYNASGAANNVTKSLKNWLLQLCTENQTSGASKNNRDIVKSVLTTARDNLAMSADTYNRLNDLVDVIYDTRSSTLISAMTNMLNNGTLDDNFGAITITPNANTVLGNFSMVNTWTELYGSRSLILGNGSQIYLTDLSDTNKQKILNAFFCEDHAQAAFAAATLDVNLLNNLYLSANLPNWFFYLSLYFGEDSAMTDKMAIIAQQIYHVPESLTHAIIQNRTFLDNNQNLFNKITNQSNNNDFTHQIEDFLPKFAQLANNFTQADTTKIIDLVCNSTIAPQNYSAVLDFINTHPSTITSIITQLPSDNNYNLGEVLFPSPNSAGRILYDQIFQSTLPVSDIQGMLSVVLSLGLLDKNTADTINGYMEQIRGLQFTTAQRQQLIDSLFVTNGPTKTFMQQLVQNPPAGGTLSFRDIISAGTGGLTMASQLFTTINGNTLTDSEKTSLLNNLHDLGVIDTISAAQLNQLFLQTPAVVTSVVVNLPADTNLNFYQALQLGGNPTVWAGYSASQRTQLITALSSAGYITPTIAGQLTAYFGYDSELQGFIKNNPAIPYSFNSALNDEFIHDILTGSDNAKTSNLLNALALFGLVNNQVKAQLDAYYTAPSNLRDYIVDNINRNNIPLFELLDSAVIYPVLTAGGVNASNVITNLQNYGLINATTASKLTAFVGYDIRVQSLLQSLDSIIFTTASAAIANDIIRAIMNGNDSNLRTQMLDALQSFGYISASVRSQLTAITQASDELVNLISAIPANSQFTFLTALNNSSINNYINGHNNEDTLKLVNALYDAGFIAGSVRNKLIGYGNATSAVRNILRGLTNMGADNLLSFTEALQNTGVNGLLNGTDTTSQNGFLTQALQGGFVNNDTQGKLQLYISAGPSLRAIYNNLPAGQFTLNNALNNPNIASILNNGTAEQKRAQLQNLADFGLISSAVHNQLEAIALASPHIRDFMVQPAPADGWTLINIMNDSVANDIFTGLDNDEKSLFIDTIMNAGIINAGQAQKLQSFAQSPVGVQNILKAGGVLSFTQAIQNSIIKNTLTSGDILAVDDMLGVLGQFAVINNQTTVALRNYANSTADIRAILDNPPTGGQFSDGYNALQNDDLYNALVNLNPDEVVALLNGLQSFGVINNNLYNSLLAFSQLPDSLKPLFLQYPIGGSYSYNGAVANVTINGVLAGNDNDLKGQLIESLANFGYISEITKQRLAIYAGTTNDIRAILQNEPLGGVYSLLSAVGNDDILAILQGIDSNSKIAFISNLRDFGYLSATNAQKLTIFANLPVDIQNIITQTPETGNWTLAQLLANASPASPILNGTQIAQKNQLITGLYDLGLISSTVNAQITAMANADVLVKNAIAQLENGRQYSAIQIIQNPVLAQIYQSSPQNIIDQLNHNLLGFGFVDNNGVALLQQYTGISPVFQEILAQNITNGFYANINEVLNNSPIFNYLRGNNNDRLALIDLLAQYNLISNNIKSQLVFYTNSEEAVQNILHPAPATGQFSYNGILANVLALNILNNGNGAQKTALIDGLSLCNYINSATADNLRIYAFAPQIIKNILNNNPINGQYSNIQALANPAIGQILDSGNETDIAFLLDGLVLYNFIANETKNQLAIYATLPNNIKNIIKAGNNITIQAALAQSAIQGLFANEPAGTRLNALQSLRDFGVFNANTYNKLVAYNNANAAHRLILSALPANATYTSQSIFQNASINAIMIGQNTSDKADLLIALRDFGAIDQTAYSQLSALIVMDNDIQAVVKSLNNGNQSFLTIINNADCMAIFAGNNNEKKQQLSGALANFGVIANPNIISAIEYFAQSSGDSQNATRQLGQLLSSNKLSLSPSDLLQNTTTLGLLNQSGTGFINQLYQGGLINDSVHNGMLNYNNAPQNARDALVALLPILPNNANQLIQNAQFQAYLMDSANDLNKILSNLLANVGYISDLDKNKIMTLTTITPDILQYIAGQCATSPVAKLSVAQFLQNDTMRLAITNANATMRQYILQAFAVMGIIDNASMPVLQAYLTMTNPAVRQLMVNPPVGGQFATINSILMNGDFANILFGNDNGAKTTLISDLRNGGLISGNLANQLLQIVNFPAGYLQFMQNNPGLLSGNIVNILGSPNLAEFLLNNPGQIGNLIQGLYQSGVLSQNNKDKMLAYLNAPLSVRASLLNLLRVNGFSNLGGNQFLSKAEPADDMANIKAIYNNGSDGDKQKLTQALVALGIVGQNGASELQYFATTGAAMILQKLDETITDSELEQFTSERFLTEVKKTSVAISFDTDKNLFKWGESYITFQTFMTLMTGRLANASTIKLDSLIGDMKKLAQQKKLMNRLNAVLLGMKNYITTNPSKGWVGGINGYQYQINNEVPVVGSDWKSGMSGGGHSNDAISTYISNYTLGFMKGEIQKLFTDFTDENGNAITKPTPFVDERYGGVNVFLYYFNYIADKVGLNQTLNMTTTAANDYNLSATASWETALSAISNAGGAWQQKIGGFNNSEWNSKITKDQIDLMQTGFKNLMSDVESAINLKQVDIDRYSENRSNLVQALQDRIEKINQTNKSVIR